MDDSRGTGTNWNWNADGHTKTNNYCDQSNTEVLAVPIALTLIVNITCIAIFALLCCTYDDFNAWCIVVDCGVRAIHVGLELVRRWTHGQRRISTAIGAIRRFWQFQLH
jgi:hypothetical protein